MAGPSVLVRILGDLSGLAKSAGDAGSAAAAAGSRIHSAFSSVLGTLNKTGVLGPFSEALAAVDEGLTGIAEHAKTVGGVMLGVGGVMVGVGGTLAALGSKEKASHQQLQAAVEASGHSYEDYAEKIEKAIKGNEKYGQSSEATQDALRVLTQATGDPAKALQMLGTATDLAAAKHIDLTSAATALGKVYNGNTKLLKEFGVTVGTSAKVAMSQLSSATKQATSADKAAADAKQRLADLQERLGASNKTVEVSTGGVTAAQQRLAAAQQRLSQLEAIDATHKKLTISQQFALSNAHQAVTRAVAGVSAAQLKYGAAEQTAAKSAGLSVAQQQALRNAQQRVTDTSAAAVAAHKKLTDAQATATKSAHGQTDAITSLSNKLHGQAAAAADTFTGRLKGITTVVEDQVAQFGAKYGPAITAAGGAITVMGGAVEGASAILKTFKTGQEAATAATEAATAATEAGTVAEGLALGPILLIIAAIAALVAAAYLIYRNWSTIWSAMKAAVVAVWSWIKTNWPLLLAILLGPIGIAVDLIVKYWAQIRSAAAAVLVWIRTNWPLIVAVLTGPIGVAVLAIIRNWNTITATVSSVISTIEGLWNGFVGFIGGLAGRIGGVAAGMWNGILAAFRAMVNGIIDIWNSLHFTLPKINAGPIHIGGETIGVPQIPHLAQGGVITRDGLVYAHAGEAITPARSGPAVVVQNANFASELDVEAFMRRAAWVVRTARA